MTSHTYRSILTEEMRKAMMMSWLERGASIQEALGISSEKMAEYYEYAQKLYDEKKLQESADILLLLSVVNPYVYELWLARGVAESALFNHGESLYAFHMAIALDPSRSEAYLGLINVLNSQHENEAALEVEQLMKQHVEEKKNVAE